MKRPRKTAKVAPGSIFSPPVGVKIHFDYERSLFVDCDDTLVFMEPLPGKKMGRKVWMDHFGYHRGIYVHEAHVALIKEFATRDIGIFVWSHGGIRWAKAVVKALGLEKFVHVIPKATDWILDDKPPVEWLGKLLYIPLEDQNG
jgi:hypothetical protein